MPIRCLSPAELTLTTICHSQREKTRSIADAHANLAKTVEGSIVQHLQKLRTELKAHVKNIQQDTGKLAAAVARERELSTKMITDLARSITMLKNTPMGVHAKEDPWYINARSRASFLPDLILALYFAQVHQRSGRSSASETGPRGELAPEEHHHHAAKL